MLSDEFIRRLVHSQPIPDRLIDALADTPLVKNPRRYSGTRVSPIVWETLKLVAAGLQTKEIAARQGVPYWTANDRVKRVLHRLDCKTRVEAVARCYREGII